MPQIFSDSIRQLLSVLIAGSFLLGSVTAEELRPTFKFCEDPWPPYTTGVNGAPPTGGLAVELFKQLEIRLGFAFQLKLLPWKRCLFWAKQGKFDGVMLLTKDAERATYLEFPTAVHYDANLVWARKDRVFGRNFRSFEDFRGLKIGVTDGFNYGDAFKAAVKRHQLNLDSGPNISSNLHRLHLERIDIFLVNGIAGESALEEIPELKGAFTVYRGPFEAVPFYIGLSKASPISEYLPVFNDALQDMKRDGTLTRIFGAQPPP